MMTRIVIALTAFVFATSTYAKDPDYSIWAALLARYNDPAHGFDYESLHAHDMPSLNRLRRQMQHVDVASLTADEQLAFWINLYNISAVSLIVENYPLDSIRELSSDPVLRMNVFRRDFIRVGDALLSLDEILDKRLRKRFHDPRVHLALNWGARGCPPLAREPYVGARVHRQLDAQAHAFLSTKNIVRIGKRDSTPVLHLPMIFDWFSDDFERWGEGRGTFVAKYLAPERRRLLRGTIRLEFDGFDWSLDQWKRSDGT